MSVGFFVQRDLLLGFFFTHNHRKYTIIHARNIFYIIVKIQ